MARLYKVYNAPAPTTAKIVAVTTGTNIKTLLQIAPPSTVDFIPVAWGIDFDGSAAATPGSVELIETDVAATVTAHVAAGIHKMNAAALQLASQVTLGTAATGYTASAEGTITATRVLDAHLIAPTNQFGWQWPLGREGYVAVSKFLRVRVHFAAAINALCWVEYEE